MGATFPNFKHEKELISQGFRVVVGVDEAGSGALAGPVVAGAVVLPMHSRLGELDDSKAMTLKARERLFEAICTRAEAFAVGIASVDEINTIGIRPANYLAMMRAIEQIDDVDFVLVDAWTLPDLKLPQRGIIRGDHLVKSIAAASIIAKVSRDKIMRELATTHPNYGFDIHKGYGTAFHTKQIKTHGPCEVHRTSWGCFTNTSKSSR